MNNEQKSAARVLACIFLVALGFVVLLVTGAMVGLPQYAIYKQRLAGEAELAQAEYSKKVQIRDAEAKAESAKALAQAEITRAQGVAQANKIIGDSLSGNEAYLRYLWINKLGDAEGKGQVIYVPTEANLPILEANRLKGPQQ